MGDVVASEIASDSVETGGPSSPPRVAEEKLGQKIQNPFDHFLTDGSHAPAFSPSIFATVVSPSATDSPDSRPSNSGTKLRLRTRKPYWTIDHIAALNPAHIDESELALQESHAFDAETEARIQCHITKYFSQPTIAPSPLTSGRKRKSLFRNSSISRSNSPSSNELSFNNNRSVESDLEAEYSNAKLPDDDEDDVDALDLSLSSSPAADRKSPPIFFLGTNYFDADCSSTDHRTSVGTKRLSSPQLSPIKNIIETKGQP